MGVQTARGMKNSVEIVSGVSFVNTVSTIFRSRSDLRPLSSYVVSFSLVKSNNTIIDIKPWLARSQILSIAGV
jgi:hypothetical protein